LLLDKSPNNLNTVLLNEISTCSVDTNSNRMSYVVIKESNAETDNEIYKNGNVNTKKESQAEIVNNNNYAYKDNSNSNSDHLIDSNIPFFNEKKSNSLFTNEENRDQIKTGSPLTKKIRLNSMKEKENSSSLENSLSKMKYKLKIPNDVNNFKRDNSSFNDLEDLNKFNK